MGGGLSRHDSPSVADTSAPSNLDKDQMLAQAEKEMGFRIDHLNRLAQTCFNKCVDKRYKDSELYIGENSCVDRCVSKYIQVTNIIGHIHQFEAATACRANSSILSSSAANIMNDDSTSKIHLEM
ncbi:mitochondrial import inner membrane translocase subunit TIM10-like isoform X2 [Musa acuminata AAA Group]|uniref:mitochondrial import inner membrane translocase subunit TIM10-like isoform X2 n=1 Tax=Musa acuminata AAA Group TaxID=214697 RepID=UPI0031D11341